jgi:hypothetical protein
MELDSLRPYLIEEFQEWVQEQRRLHLTNARPLSNEERSRFVGYFEKRILDLVRLASVERILNPGFYDGLVKSGLPIPLDFSNAIGLTLVDCILIRRELWSDPPSAISTLFHEMVHVVQIHILGLRKHIELYADNLIQNGYQYHSVLFERQAYTLASRFARGEPSFSVGEIVRQELGHAEYNVTSDSEP